MNYFVYIWLHTDGTAYYIGEGQGTRWWRTRNIPRPRSKDLVQKFILSSKEECWEYEEFLIRFFGRLVDGGTLMNKTFGGRYGRGREATKEECEAISKAKHKPVDFLSPDGVVVSVQNYSEHCRVYGLSTSHFSLVARGIRRVCQGWMLADPDLRPPSRAIRRGITRLIDADGEVFEVENLKKFAEELGIAHSAFYSLANGKLDSAHGYRLAEPVHGPRSRKRNYKFEPLLLTSPDGNDYEVRHLTAFAAQQGLTVEGLVGLAKGNLKSHNGWYLRGVRPVIQPCYNREPVKVIHDNGQIVEITNLSAFARRYSVSSSRIRDVIRGNKQTHSGWSLAKT